LTHRDVGFEKNKTESSGHVFIALFLM